MPCPHTKTRTIYADGKAIAIVCDACKTVLENLN